MVVLIFLLVFVLAVYSVSSYSILRDEIRQGSANFLNVYGGELKSRVKQMDNVMKNLLLQNYSKLQLLKSVDETKRFYASQDINNYISDVALSDTSVDCIIVADNRYGICVDAESTVLSYWDRTALRAFAMECTERENLTARWDFIDLNCKTYLYKIFIYNGRAAAAFTTSQHFMETIPPGDYGGQTFVLTDETGTVIDFLGDNLFQGEKGRPLEETGAVNSFTVAYNVADGQLMLYSLVRDASVWNQIQISMMVVLAVILFTIIFGTVLIRYVQREMIHPMTGMTKVMNQIDKGEYSLQIEGEFKTQEFTHLKDSFNKLMSEIINLKIQAYEKIIELKDAELKSIRLQIRPHFFLNALTTILSLSSRGKSKQIKAYVEALSKNIRYMFKSGLRTVTVKEEIRHIEDYFEMQEFKYKNCTFHYIELPPELEEWRIPQMLIQTFIENEFKYAVYPDHVLTILIRIQKCDHMGEEMLSIEIEDNGKGYPEDVLLYMNGDRPNEANNGKRVGLWSIKRIMELMYERSDLITLSNIKPHGCLNRILVPAKPVNEVRQMGIDCI